VRSTSAINWKKETTFNPLDGTPKEGLEENEKNIYFWLEKTSRRKRKEMTHST
jgi:hypothetical protein